MIDTLQQYPTFLVFIAAFLAIVFTIVLLPILIRTMRKDHIGQQVRAEGPESHMVKQGTPTMGGVVMILAAVIACLPSFSQPDIVVLAVTTVLTGLLGFSDDMTKIVEENSLGLSPRAKLIWQFTIATVFCLVAVNWLDISPVVDLPFIARLDLGVWTTTITLGSAVISIPWLYLIFVDILLAGMCNAVNLTDGLDGLAAGSVMVVMFIMAAIAYRADMISEAIFAAAIAGSCIGFLWFNAYPAECFMGDTGALALGMAFGCLAVLTKTEVVSIIIGGLFVCETLSVIIQVLHYKRTHRRVFLMSPIHHHFEKKGWGETKVVIRFWIISGLFAAFGFALYFAWTLFPVTLF